MHWSLLIMLRINRVITLITVEKHTIDYPIQMWKRLAFWDTCYFFTGLLTMNKLLIRVHLLMKEIINRKRWGKCRIFINNKLMLTLKKDFFSSFLSGLVINYVFWVAEKWQLKTKEITSMLCNKIAAVLEKGLHAKNDWVIASIFSKVRPFKLLQLTWP